MKIYQIDAFTDHVFGGNPAGVVPLDSWPTDETLQAIASEMNLSETAFFAEDGESDADFLLRWFTPTVEVELCGHATLAAAHVLFEHVGHPAESIEFRTLHRCGLVVSRSRDGTLAMDFPAYTHERVALESSLGSAVAEAIGDRADEIYRSSNNILAVFDSKRRVLEIKPDFKRVAALDALGVIVTGPGTRHDFVSRYFAPGAGVDEDPVTGSAHCSLAPYWATRLGKSCLTAHQVSKRGGAMVCEMADSGDRVRLIGKAVTFFEGEMAGSVIR